MSESSCKGSQRPPCRPLCRVPEAVWCASRAEGSCSPRFKPQPGLQGLLLPTAPQCLPLPCYRC